MITILAVIAPLVACSDPSGNAESNGTGDTSGDGDGDGDTGDGDGDGDESCPDGQSGCDCYGNMTCNEGLECVEGTCISSSCVDGTLDCACYGNDTCNDGLECNANGLCVPASGDGDGDGDGDPTAGDGDGDPTGDGDGDGDPTGDGDGDPTGDGDGDGDGDPCMDVPDDMVCVPAGSFEMGTDLNTFLGSMVDPQEKPAHMVTITNTFWIDKTEVTAADYAQCWGAQVCSIPSMNNNQWPTWAVAGKENHPINGVNYYQAKEYCEWKGKRLPTEAEWEYAARGDDGRMYPWGNEAPTCSHIVADNCGNPQGTAPVGSKPDGASPFGALDMISNVLEWTADYYQADYYYNSPEVDPQGPDSGSSRSVRGATAFMYSISAYPRATVRFGWMTLESNHISGFRCAQDPP